MFKEAKFKYTYVHKDDPIKLWADKLGRRIFGDESAIEEHILDGEGRSE